MYNSIELRERIRIVLKEKGITQKEMLQALGLKENILNQMSKENAIAAFKLAKIADYLNCSVDYLLGRTEERMVNSPHMQTIHMNLENVNGENVHTKAVINAAKMESDIPSRDVEELCDLLFSLPLRERTKLLSMMYGYLEELEKQGKKP